MSYRPITDTWILARSKTKDDTGKTYYGAYLSGFLERARPILVGGDKDASILHICGGMARNYNGYEKEKQLVGYHVTRRKSISSIKRKGLIPKIPDDYGTSGDTKGVYLFKSRDDTETALAQWFGQRIDEWEEEHGQDYDEVILVVNLTGMEGSLLDSVEYEWTCIDKILPERIMQILESDFEPIQPPHPSGLKSRL